MMQHEGPMLLGQQSLQHSYQQHNHSYGPAQHHHQQHNIAQSHHMQRHHHNGDNSNLSLPSPNAIHLSAHHGMSSAASNSSGASTSGLLDPNTAMLATKPLIQNVREQRAVQRVAWRATGPYGISAIGDAHRGKGTHAPAKAIFLVSNLLILACIPFRLMGDTEAEEAILIFAVPGSWFLLMFFAGAIRLTGPFVTMIYSMITGDMFTFGIIYSIVLCGFSQAFYFLYKGHPQIQSTMFNTFPSTWMALFQTTLGDYNYPDLNNTTYPNLSKTVFVIFMIFVPILLLNMLIAMMGNTYAQVIERSEKEWMKQWAKIVVTLERAVPQADAKNYLEAYSIPLGPIDDSGYEVRGVMVIKSKAKTRAKQRKGAVSNWKRVGRVTLSALKKRGMTGEQMRRLMWGRASISSPIKITKKKLKDPYNLNPQNDLTTAMDMLSFANDPASSAGIQLRTSLNGTAANGTLSCAQQQQKQHQPTPDPLRDLIFLADQRPDMHDPQYFVGLQQLANQALDLVEQTMGMQPIPIPATSNFLLSQAALQPAATTASAALSTTATSTAAAAVAAPTIDLVTPLSANVTSLFQEPKDVVDPQKLQDFLKMLAEIETEESDCGGRPILGKLSLSRRTKSALSKAQIKKETIDGSPEKLIPSVWSHPLPQADDVPEFNFVAALAEEHTLTIQQEAEVETETGNERDESDDDCPTAEEVHATMKQFHLRKRQYQQDDAARRAKSARIKRKNRISPEQSNEGDNDSGSNGGKTTYPRGASAPGRKHAANERLSPPDPLEPWSTRELQNINKILARK